MPITVSLNRSTPTVEQFCVSVRKSRLQARCGGLHLKTQHLGARAGGKKIRSLRLVGYIKSNNQANQTLSYHTPQKLGESVSK